MASIPGHDSHANAPARPNASQLSLPSFPPVPRPLPPSAPGSAPLYTPGSVRHASGSTPTVPLHLPSGLPYAASSREPLAFPAPSFESLPAPRSPTTPTDSELQVNRQRVPLAMPHPEIPLSVQSQLLRASADGPQASPSPKVRGNLPPVYIPARTSLQAPVMSPDSPNRMPSGPNFSARSSPVARPSPKPGVAPVPFSANQASPSDSPRTSMSSPFSGVASPSLGPGARRFGSEMKSAAGQLTVDQFETVRRQAATQPHDPRAQLDLARNLLEASDHLANYYEDPARPSTVEVDLAQQQRNRDAWNSQALKIARHLAQKAMFPDAMFLLGSVYSSRRYGVEMNYIKALEWYHKAAKLDHAEAANRIAVCEEFGVGTPRNAEKAVNWYKRAAMLGSTGAMYKLGMLAMLGALDQPRDFRTGLSWLQRAAERADHKTPHAVHELALLNEHSSLSTYVAGDPLVRNDSKALELFYTAAQLGYAPSQARLGRAYEFGELGCEINPEYSVSWYSQAAQQGDSNGELAMAGWYWTGAPNVLKKNETEAFLWAERAAQRGNTRALYCVGYFYETGTGVPLDLKRAKKFYALAAEKNHPRAVQKLNEMY